MSKLYDVYKTIQKPCTKWSGYFDVYDRHLERFRGTKPKILEIGIYEGGSLEMWSNYFEDGCVVYGIDIDKKCLDYKYNENIKVIIGDQESVSFWNEFFEEHGKFDIIIDDGGHTMRQQITTLEQCFPNLNDGGVLIVEDVHTSYFNDYNGGYGRRNTFMEYAKRTTDIPNKQFYGNILATDYVNRFTDLYSISFYNSQVVFEKKHVEKFTIIDNGTKDKENGYDWIKQYEA